MADVGSESESGTDTDIESAVEEEEDAVLDRLEGPAQNSSSADESEYSEEDFEVDEQFWDENYFGGDEAPNEQNIPKKSKLTVNQIINSQVNR